MNKINNIPVTGEFDVIVCGGGPAGCAAAISAARSGVKTLLLEKNAYLGGATVSQLVVVVLSTNEVDFTGIWHEYADKLKKYDGFTGLHQAPNPYYPDFSWQRGSVDPEQVKRVWQELARESNVEILHYGTVIDVLKENNKLVGVELFCCGTRQVLMGKRIIDATGNADIAVLAGCEWERGSEPEIYTQEVSLVYRSLQHNEGMRPEVFGRKNRKCVDPLDIRDITAATIAMREEIWREQEPYQLLETASDLGIRTSRIVAGCDKVSNDDAWNLEKHPHGIVRCSWELDVHPTGLAPIDNHLYHSKSKEYHERLKLIEAGEWFDIPYGALVARDVDNLLLTGRIVSSELFAQGSLRIQQTCMATGEAAGKIAALSVDANITPSEMNPEIAVKSLKLK